MRITRANTKAINYACKNFHYAKVVPPVLYGYNIYNDKDEWCGVILYGAGSNPSIARIYGKHSGEVLELVRVALNGKQEVTSKAVAMSLRQLKKDNPLCKMVVSYADHRQEHLGIIYQATNWIYVGESITGGYEYFYKGRWTHPRTISYYKNKNEIKANCPKRKTSNKFKYIFCFDKKERKKYLKMALPYPKQKDLTQK